jgi:hypothetical protein
MEQVMSNHARNRGAAGGPNQKITTYLENLRARNDEDFLFKAAEAIRQAKRTDRNGWIIDVANEIYKVGIKDRTLRSEEGKVFDRIFVAPVEEIKYYVFALLGHVTTYPDDDPILFGYLLRTHGIRRSDTRRLTARRLATILRRDLRKKTQQSDRDKLTRRERLVFDTLTQTVTLDGIPEPVADPRAYGVYKAIFDSLPNPITKKGIRKLVPRCQGVKTIPQLIESLPLRLKKTIAWGKSGYYLRLPTVVPSKKKQA